MGLRDLIRQAFQEIGPPPARNGGLAECAEEAPQAGRLELPRNVHDQGGWDEYWSFHLGHQQRFESEMHERRDSEPMLPMVLGRRGSRKILCVGNGLSYESLSLALHGFEVTSLDISSVAREAMVANLRSQRHPLQRIPGVRMSDDGTVDLREVVSPKPELCPRVHQSPDFPPRGGGLLSFVTGDLIDPEVCPGPFDVVIERRTGQLFPPEERLLALDGLLARLSDRGVFVSHHHEPMWPPGGRRHYAEAPLLSKGFAALSEKTAQDPVRLAYLPVSSG